MAARDPLAGWHDYMRAPSAAALARPLKALNAVGAAMGAVLARG